MAESQNSQHEHMKNSVKDWSLAVFPCYSLQPIHQRDSKNLTKTRNALIINKSFPVIEKYFHHKKQCIFNYNVEHLFNTGTFSSERALSTDAHGDTSAQALGKPPKPASSAGTAAHLHQELRGL